MRERTSKPNNINQNAPASRWTTKKADLQAVFADMNVLASRTETRTETDGETEVVTRTYFIIETTHKTASEMAEQYGFSDEQKEYLTELLSDEYDSFWSSVLYGFE